MAVGPNGTKENDKSVNKEKPEPKPITDKAIIDPIDKGLKQVDDINRR